MADPITNAKLERKRLERELDAIREKLNKVDSFIELYDLFADNKSFSIPLPPPVLAEAPKKLTVADRVALLLADGFPRKPHDLLRELEADGNPIGSGDEGRRITNLSSQLSRDKQRFQSSRKWGWSLRAQPKPQMENPPAVDADGGWVTKL